MHNNMKTTTRIISVVTSLVILAASFTLIEVGQAGKGEPDMPSSPVYWLLGKEKQISLPTTPTSDAGYPEIAFNTNHQEFLVVWRDIWSDGSPNSISGARVSVDGEVLDQIVISSGQGGDGLNREMPDVAYSSDYDSYLVVWEKEVGTLNVEIWGKFIDWDFVGVGYEFSVQNPNINQFLTSPRVAWNSVRNEFMVVWNTFDNSANPLNIMGKRVWLNAGNPNLSSYFTLTDQNGPQKPDLAYNAIGNEYFLVFEANYPDLPDTGQDIYGLRVDWSGAIIATPGLIEVDKNNRDQYHPAVAFNGLDALGRYLVVWEEEWSVSDSDIYARRYTREGSSVGNRFDLAMDLNCDVHPDVAAYGANREWLVVWQRNRGLTTNLYGYQLVDDALLATPYEFELTNPDSYHSRNPGVALNGPGYFIIYDETPPSGSDRAIFGTQWWPEAIYLPIVRK